MFKILIAGAAALLATSCAAIAPGPASDTTASAGTSRTGTGPGDRMPSGRTLGRRAAGNFLHRARADAARRHAGAV